jgi:hypothetical protein
MIKAIIFLTLFSWLPALAVHHFHEKDGWVFGVPVLIVWLWFFGYMVWVVYKAQI